MSEIILTSFPERRREILKSLGLKFEVVEPRVNEGMSRNIPLKGVPEVLTVCLFGSYVS